MAAVPPSIHARQAASPPATARSQAPFDLTGRWVTVVTEDWRVRMVTPQKGDYESVPISAEGRRIADAWGPARDEASGAACKAYGAPAIMRVPGHFRFSWEDDNTLRIETTAGTQTRRFHFGSVAAPAGTGSWQGHSVAQWELGERGQSGWGSIKVTTTHLRPGYLRKNGVPYGENTVLTEHYDRIVAPNGEEWLIITTEVVDPVHLSTPFITSTHFKKVPDSTPWTPEPCSAR